VKRVGAPRLAGTLLAAALILGACAKVQVQEPREAGLGIGPGDGVTVLANYGATSGMSLEEAQDIERDAAGCVEHGFRRMHVGVRLVPADRFRAAVFPGMTFGEAPQSPESLVLLMDNAEYLRRVSALGIRYLVVVGGGTERTKSGEIFCGAGYGGAACFGLIVWEQTSKLGALILDVTRAQQARQLAVSARGHAWLAVLAILPVGFPTFTRGKTCDAFGETVAHAIVRTELILPPPASGAPG
jgi:hypothetical protein